LDLDIIGASVFFWNLELVVWNLPARALQWQAGLFEI
jgi:hypothetical protein